MIESQNQNDSKSNRNLNSHYQESALFSTLSCHNQNMSMTVVYSFKVRIKAHMIKCYAFYLLYLRVVLFVCCLLGKL